MRCGGDTRVRSDGGGVTERFRRDGEDRLSLDGNLSLFRGSGDDDFFTRAPVSSPYFSLARGVTELFRFADPSDVFVPRADSLERTTAGIGDVFRFGSVGLGAFFRLTGDPDVFFEL